MQRKCNKMDLRWICYFSASAIHAFHPDVLSQTSARNSDLCPVSRPEELSSVFPLLLPPPLTPADGQRLRVAALLDELIAALHHALQLSLVTGNTQEPG